MSTSPGPGRPPQRQLMPRRLQIVIEKLDLAKESFQPQSPEWILLDDCQAQIKRLHQWVIK